LAFANLSNALGSATYPVSLLVSNPPPLQLAGLNLLTNGALAMRLEGVPGRVYSLVASTNLLYPLASWTEVLRVTNTSGLTTFTNPAPPASPCYYRAKEL
jgi:hypothetical protein